jgi:catechol 2,3-dioxygenase-like lactoylglutathione lyase family enzyme
MEPSPRSGTALSMKSSGVMLSVADVDRAKGFYQRLGWRLDIEFTTAQAGPLQGLFLLVDDIEAAHGELKRRGIDVSEVWHLEPGEGRRPGRDPERRSYLSRASFDDPDGNTWVLQEITERLPDWEQVRHSGALPQLLYEASVRRGEFEAVAAPHDWWDWYAAYMEACEQGITQEKAAEAAARHMANIKRIVVASA